MGVLNQLPCNPNLGLDWIELGWKLGCFNVTVKLRVVLFGTVVGGSVLVIWHCEYFWWHTAHYLALQTLNNKFGGSVPVIWHCN